MLVLSRRLGQRIHVGDDVVIEVMELKDGRVSLGFIAPKEVPILREELVVKERLAERRVRPA